MTMLTVEKTRLVTTLSCFFKNIEIREMSEYQADVIITRDNVEVTIGAKRKDRFCVWETGTGSIKIIKTKNSSGDDYDRLMNDLSLLGFKLPFKIIINQHS
jgi:hypothetical protein